jgi:hypothetical protein
MGASRPSIGGPRTWAALRVLAVAGLAAAALAAAGCRAREDAFTQRVAKRLRETRPGLEVTVAARFHIQTRNADGSRNDVYLDNLWRECQAQGGDCEEAIGRHVRLSGQFTPDLDSYVKAEAVRAVLKDREWLANVREMTKKKGPPEKARENEIVSRPFAGDLFVVYVFDMPDGMRMVARGDMAKLKLDEAKLEALAIANLEATLPALTFELLEPGSKIRVVHVGDSYEASRLLLHAWWKPVAGQLAGDLVVAAPTRDYVFFTGAREDVAGLRSLARRVSDEGGHALSPRLLRWTQAGWEAYP